MSSAPEPTGGVDVALAHAARLLNTDVALAAEQAAEILKVVPGHPMALMIASIAARNRGDATHALELQLPLAQAQPQWAAAQFELGLTLAALGRGDDAVAHLREAVRLKPDLADAWRALGDHLTAIGDTAGADAAYASHIKAATRDPRLLAPAAALQDGRIAVAESLLREHLKKHPTDVPAIRMLAEVAARLGRNADAELLLERCLELAPSFTMARHHYAVVLLRQNKVAEALAEAARLLEVEPRNPGYRNLKAAILSRLGEYQQSIDLYESVLAEYPRQGKVWLSYGHGLKTAGRQADSIAAYRKCVELAPQFGEAWWSLANLKTVGFDAQDRERMLQLLERSDLTPEDRFHLDFALGKAFEDAGAYAESFGHYAAGNRLRRAGIQYDADETSSNVARARALYTPEFLAERRSFGATAPDPIFIVGLPRSGSTLLEQILASHSQVEGTMELPDLIALVRGLGGRTRRSGTSRYPEVLASMNADELRELGERYLRQTRIQRKTDAPFFIDKLPNNWAHVGLIHLMLPNAKIIDARRHPMSCCFSGYKQHFARGQNFTYSLEDIGRYYRDYVGLMAHFDTVLPGRVHRVIYESMVDDTEGEVRRVLAHCGLPFEPACLAFHENERAVRTASSEQVRMPIFRDALEHWRHYEPWLAPLSEALGPVLAAYPAAPAGSD